MNPYEVLCVRDFEKKLLARTATEKAAIKSVEMARTATEKAAIKSVETSGL